MAVPLMANPGFLPTDHEQNRRPGRSTYSMGGWRLWAVLTVPFMRIQSSAKQLLKARFSRLSCLQRSASGICSCCGSSSMSAFSGCLCSSHNFLSQVTCRRRSHAFAIAPVLSADRPLPHPPHAGWPYEDDLRDQDTVKT